MSEKIIYINNINNFPDIQKKQWILKKTDNLKFVYNLSTRDTIWFVIIKAFKKEIYYGKIEYIIKNNNIFFIIFNNNFYFSIINPLFFMNIRQIIYIIYVDNFFTHYVSI